MIKLSFVILLLLPLITLGQAEKRYRSIIVDSLKGLNGGRIDVKDTLLLDSLAVYNTDLSSQYTSRSLVDSAFVGVAISSGGGNTIYNADDNLAGNRIVTMGANSLTFSGNQTTFKGIDATSSNFVLKLTDNVSTDLMAVRNDGNVGIGVLPNSPTNERLVVKGSGVGTVVIGQVFGITQLGAIGVHGSLSQTAYTLAKNNNTTDVLLNVPTAAGELIFREAGVDRAVFSQTSFSTKTKMKLGISGGADPLSQLETRSTVNGTNTWSASFFDDNPFATGVGGGIYFLGRINATTGESGFAAIRGLKANNISNDPLGELAFYTGTNGNTEAVRIDELGNVGIGLSDPTQKLEVNGNVKISGQLSTDETEITLGVAAITFVTSSNVMTITGDGGGNTIATITGAISGQSLIMIFVDNKVTITDDNGHGANTIDLSAAFTSVDDTVLHLIYNGTSWYEVSRSIN